MSDDRPSSWGAALESAEAAATAPPTGDATGTAPVETEAAASSAAEPTSTVTPDAADPSAVPPTVAPADAEGKQPGPIPFERHKAILDKARREAAEQFGWAQRIPADVGPVLAQNWDRFVQLARDPVGFASGLIADLQADPQYAAQLRSQAARVLATRSAAPAPVADPQADAEPEPDIVVDGHRWYSAEQQAKRDQWRERQILQRVQQEFAPLTKLHAELQQAREIIAAQQQVDASAERLYSRFKQYPHFAENQTAIAERFRDTMQGRPDEESGMALYEAYIDVLQSKVLPTLAARTQRDTLQTLQTTAAASTVNPSAPSPPSTGRPKSWAEALKSAGA